MTYKDLLYDNGKKPIFLSFASTGVTKTDKVIGFWYADMQGDRECFVLEGLSDEELQGAEKFTQITPYIYGNLHKSSAEDALKVLHMLHDSCNIFSYNEAYAWAMVQSLVGGKPTPPIVIRDIFSLVAWKESGQVTTGTTTLEDLYDEVKRSKFFRIPTLRQMRRMFGEELNPVIPVPEQNCHLLVNAASWLSDYPLMTDQV